MAKKIIFSFSGIPSLGLGFNCTINYNGLPIYFNSGEAAISFKYLAQGSQDLPPSQVERQGTLDATINKTLAFLNSYYYNENVVYQRVNNTIEATVSLSDLVISITNQIPELTISTVDISDAQNLNLKYFFQYTNIVNDTFLCQIFKKRYIGVATEINGTATIEKGSVKNHTDPIRGTGLSIELEANVNLTFEDLYTENEQDFIVKFYKNNKLIFNGFLKPDGIFQSYTRDEWIISLDCVDGLGALENLSFVKESGFRFNGKLKALDIIYNCLKRTSIIMPINTSINILYNGLTYSDNLDILTKIYLNSDRFFKNDSQSTGDGTLMSCEEVLKSVLDIFSACITQEDGEWYIYKSDEVFRNNNVLFRRYNVNNVYVGNKTLSLSKKIGSQIDNFYPHFAKGDQKINIKGSISAFRLGYKYGFVKGLILNPNFTHNEFDFNYWRLNELQTSAIINDPLNNIWLSMTPIPTIVGTTIPVLESEGIQLDLGDQFEFKASARFNGFGRAIFRVSTLGFTLNSNGEWVTGDSYITIDTDSSQLFSTSSFGLFVTIKAAPMPVTGRVIVEVFRPTVRLGLLEQNNSTRIDITSSDLVPTSKSEPYIGEFHTASRSSKVSSIVKENKTVYNGDNAGVVYVGAIFKENGISPTFSWSRRGALESFPLLRIAAETELRLGQKPLKLFTGSLFGYVPYLSIISINNLQGKFMPIKYVYDTKSNIVTFDLLELIADEISDINYVFTFDYGGNTVKPTIQG